MMVNRASAVSGFEGAQQTTIDALTGHYRQRSFDKFGIKGQLPDEETAAHVGQDILESAFFTSRGDTITNQTGQASLIDIEIAILSEKISSEMEKPSPNWHQIDSLIRMLTVYLHRKCGRHEIDLSHHELDQIKNELKNVLSTYNDWKTLCINIGCGSISIIAGCVGVGAGVTGIAQLASGAAKASAIVNSAQGIATSAGGISQGVSQSGKYFENSIELKRTLHNSMMQRARDNKETMSHSAQTSKQGQDAAKSTHDRVEEAKHQNFRAIMSPGAV